MTETPLPGSFPRFELVEWRERFGIVAGITGRGAPQAPFDMGLAGSAPVGAVLDRWRTVLHAVPHASGLIVSRQVHGTVLLHHEGAQGLTILEGADGHLTDRAGILLAVTAADCIPVYLIDPVRRAIALLHAGWRGTAAGILKRGVAQLVRSGSNVDDLLMHCGVGICGSCYEVGAEVFVDCGLEPPPAGKGGLDLRSVLAGQARGEGVESVSTSTYCSCHDRELFWSHRGSGGAEGRMAAYLGLLA